MGQPEISTARACFQGCKWAQTVIVPAVSTQFVPNCCLATVSDVMSLSNYNSIHVNLSQSFDIRMHLFGKLKMAQNAHFRLIGFIAKSS